jgi:hypothetical protein
MDRQLAVLVSPASFSLNRVKLCAPLASRVLSSELVAMLDARAVLLVSLRM